MENNFLFQVESELNKENRILVEMLLEYLELEYSTDIFYSSETGVFKRYFLKKNGIKVLYKEIKIDGEDT